MIISELNQLVEEALNEDLPNHAYILALENACEEIDAAISYENIIFSKNATRLINQQNYKYFINVLSIDPHVKLKNKIGML